METTHLSLKSLHLFSPDLAEDFDSQLSAAVADCRERPSLKAKREVNIRLVIIPHSDDPDDVTIEAITTRKPPARKLDPIRARRTARNQLQFDFDTREES